MEEPRLFTRQSRAEPLALSSEIVEAHYFMILQIPPAINYIFLNVFIIISAHSQGRWRSPGKELKYSHPITPPNRG